MSENLTISGFDKSNSILDLTYISIDCIFDMQEMFSACPTNGVKDLKLDESACGRPTISLLPMPF